MAPILRVIGVVRFQPNSLLRQTVRRSSKVTGSTSPTTLTAPCRSSTPRKTPSPAPLRSAAGRSTHATPSTSSSAPHPQHLIENRNQRRDRGAGRNFPSIRETIAVCPANHHIHHAPPRNRRGCTSRPKTSRGSATRSRCARCGTRAGCATSNRRITSSRPRPQPVVTVGLVARQPVISLGSKVFHRPIPSPSAPDRSRWRYRWATSPSQSVAEPRTRGCVNATPLADRR